MLNFINKFLKGAFDKIFRYQNTSKVFLIICTSGLGDVLLCSSLCQNIKRLFPKSHIVFITNTPFYEAAKYQKDVDDVISFDIRGKHRGLLGLIKFILTLKYKKAYASFIPYGSERNYMVSLFTGVRHIFTDCEYSRIKSSVQKQIIKTLGEPIISMPMRYEINDEIPEQLKDILVKERKYIALCTLSTGSAKNIPIETAEKLIKLFNKTEYEIIFTGKGESTLIYAQKLEYRGCKFINLVNKTSISELARVLKNCECLISCDTGTMHLGCAVSCPVAVVFYEKNTWKKWAPNPDFYRNIIIRENQTPENIYEQTLNFIRENNQNKT